MFTRKRETQPILKAVSRPALQTSTEPVTREPNTQGSSFPFADNKRGPFGLVDDRIHTPTIDPVPNLNGEPSRVPACEGIVIIGKGTRIAGEISDCILVEIQGVLEGKVEAKSVIVREGGGFQGNISAESAEISGVVEGTITVTGALSVRATAKITAETTYGHLSVEHGGKIHGNLKSGTGPVVISQEAKSQSDDYSTNGAVRHEFSSQNVEALHSVTNAGPRVRPFN